MLLFSYPETSKQLKGHSYPHGLSLNHQGQHLYHKASEITPQSAYGTTSMAYGRGLHWQTIAKPQCPPQANKSSFGLEVSSPKEMPILRKFQQHHAAPRRDDLTSPMQIVSGMNTNAPEYRIPGDSTYQPRIYADNLLGGTFTKMAMQASQLRRQPFRSSHMMGVSSPVYTQQRACSAEFRPCRPPLKLRHHYSRGF